MTRTRTATIYTLDNSQLALLVGLCVAACREALRNIDGRVDSVHELANAGPGITPQQSQTPSGSDTELRLEGTSNGDGAQEKLLLTVTEAAQTLSVGRTLIYELVRRGELPSVAIGRVRRIPRTAVEAFVRSRLSASSDGQETIEEEQTVRKERDHEHETREP